MNFNLNDPDERADYEYSMEWLNFAGTVKRWIRSQRLCKPAAEVYVVESIESQDRGVLLPEMSEEDAMGSMF